MTYYFCLNNFDIFALTFAFTNVTNYLVQVDETSHVSLSGQLKTSHTNVGHGDYLCLTFYIFALTFALRSNVDKLLGPG